MTQGQGEALLGRIKTGQNYAALAGVDWLFEAILENMQAKQTVYRQLDDICRPNCIFATNTSGLSVTAMAAATKRAARFIGMHFFNPVPVMRLLEVIRGYATADETYGLALELARKLGKDAVTVTDAPLFVVNRILMSMINEAIFVLYEGTATAEDIDKAMLLGANLPMGPLALADLIGLDTVLMIMETMLCETGDSKYRICPLLKKLVNADCYGRKTGQGFFVYNL